MFSSAILLALLPLASTASAAGPIAQPVNISFSVNPTLTVLKRQDPNEPAPCTQATQDYCTSCWYNCSIADWANDGCNAFSGPDWYIPESTCLRVYMSADSSIVSAARPIVESVTSAGRSRVVGSSASEDTMVVRAMRSGEMLCRVL